MSILIVHRLPNNAFQSTSPNSHHFLSYYSNKKKIENQTICRFHIIINNYHISLRRPMAETINIDQKAHVLDINNIDFGDYKGNRNRQMAFIPKDHMIEYFFDGKCDTCDRINHTYSLQWYHKGFYHYDCVECSICKLTIKGTGVLLINGQFSHYNCALDDSQFPHSKCAIPELTKMANN